MLCLHCSGLSGFQWKRLADRLGHRFTFLAPDFLGCGQSPASNSGLDFTYSEDLNEVITILDELPSRVRLIAHSYGGFIGLKLALARPKKVAALALYEPVIWGGLASYLEVPIEKVVARFDPQAIFLNRKLAGSALWFQTFVDYWNGSGYWQSMTTAQRQPMQETADKLFAEVREVILDKTPHDSYRNLDQPTLILHGTTSPTEVLTMKDILAQTIPNACLGCIPGGHMNPVRNPIPVNAHLQKFLDETV